MRSCMRGEHSGDSSPAPGRAHAAYGGRGGGVTRRYHLTDLGFAVWADYPDRPGRMEAHVGQFWMVVGLGGRRCRLAVTVDGREVRVEAWER
jgi:hypothetical protein